MTATETIPDPVCDSTACPDCGAAVTERCKTAAGRRTRRTHDARVHAALAAAHARPEPESPAGPGKDDLALQLTILKVLLARVTGVDADLRAQAGAAFAVGDQVPAYLSEEDRRTGANRLGRAGLSKPRESWKVTNPEAFTAWVAKHHPEEIETRPVVRNSFLSAVLAKHKAAGCWITPDGEAVQVPGIECEIGRPVLSVSPSDEADELVAAALASGRIRFDGERLAIGGAQA